MNGLAGVVFSEASRDGCVVPALGGVSPVPVGSDRLGLSPMKELMCGSDVEGVPLPMK